MQRAAQEFGLAYIGSSKDAEAPPLFPMLSETQQESIATTDLDDYQQYLVDTSRDLAFECRCSAFHIANGLMKKGESLYVIDFFLTSSSVNLVFKSF